MSGIVNSTGAVSGVIGTTVGTPVGAIGSIVQTSAETTGTTRTTISSTSFVSTVLTAAFTPTYATSDVVINLWMSVYFANSTTDCGFALQWERAISGGATSEPTSLMMGQDSGNAYGAGYLNSNEPTYEHHWSITNVLIDSPATTSACTYTLQAAHYNAETMFIGNGQNVGRWHIWFQEVKR